MKTKLFTLLLASILTFGAKAQLYTYPNVSLWNIQYSTVDSVGALPNSTYMNQFVNTGGIVTAVYGYGYYVQTSHATEWAAINVYDNTNAPQVGDSVTFSGEVIEYYNETEMQTITNFVTVSNGNQALTPPTVVGLDSIQKRKYQGMLVKVKDATAKRFNKAQVWWVFNDSTITKKKISEDTIDNIIMTTQGYTPGKNYNITGVVHLEYANWIEPRNINDIDSINVTNVGIKEYESNFANANLYPNPNNGVFTVSVSSIAEQKNTQVALIDITGRIILRKMVDLYAGTNSLPFNVTNIKKGTYFLQINNPESTSVKKVVVE